MLYLVTTEDVDGMWYDDPDGFDTLDQARDHMNSLCVAGHDELTFVIYECRQIESRNNEPLK